MLQGVIERGCGGGAGDCVRWGGGLEGGGSGDWSTTQEIKVPTEMCRRR